METALVAIIYILEVLWIIQSWLMPMRDKQNKMNQELYDLKEELKEIKKDIYIMDKGGVESMQKFYFNNIPAIVNIDDGEDEETTINTIIDILEDAGYEFEEDVEEVEGLNKLEKAKQIIKKNYRDAECGIFHTRNTLGDPMETIYFDDELQIDICRHFEYFEVFGLKKEEFKELARYYYSLMEEEVEE